MKVKIKKAPKLNKTEMEERIESLIQSVKSIDESIKKIIKSSEKWDKAVIRARQTEDRLDVYTNRFFTEVRVLPEGHNPELQGGNSKVKSENGWEDYSGAFYLDPEEREQIVIDRARDHFKHYFEDGIYHKNKKMGLFISGGGISGKKLIETIETGD